MSLFIIASTTAMSLIHASTTVMSLIHASTTVMSLILASTTVMTLIHASTTVMSQSTISHNLPHPIIKLSSSYSSLINLLHCKYHRKEYHHDNHHNEKFYQP